MIYKIDSENMSLTEDVIDKDSTKWTTDNLYNEYFSLDDVLKCLELTHRILKKYPQDPTINDFEELLRDEACLMLGGRNYDLD